MAIRRNLDIDRGLVLHLPLTEGAGSKVWDRSSYGNNGDITFGGGGEGAFWANTKDGLPVATFDGLADCINCGGDDSIRVIGDLSISAWILANELPLSTHRGILGTDYAGEYYAQWYDGDPDRWFLWQDAFTVAAISVPAYFTISTWYNIAMVRDSVNRIIYSYINGRLIDASSYSSDYDAIISVRDLYIGRAGSHAHMWTGQMCDIRLYDRILLNQEIRYLSEMRRRL